MFIYIAFIERISSVFTFAKVFRRNSCFHELESSSATKTKTRGVILFSKVAVIRRVVRREVRESFNDCSS